MSHWLATATKQYTYHTNSVYRLPQARRTISPGSPAFTVVRLGRSFVSAGTIPAAQGVNAGKGLGALSEHLFVWVGATHLVQAWRMGR